MDRSRGQREHSNDSRLGRMQTVNAKQYQNEMFDENPKSKINRMKSARDEGRDDDKPKVKRNPNFGGPAQQQQTYQSSDDDIPVGFSRRKRLSSQSSYKQQFDPHNVQVNTGGQNMVSLTRDEELGAKSNRSRKSKILRDEPPPNIEEINREIQRDEVAAVQEEIKHQETSAMVQERTDEIKREIQRDEKERAGHRHHGDHHRHSKKHKEKQGQYQSPMYMDPMRSGQNPYQVPLMLYPPSYMNQGGMNQSHMSSQMYSPPQQQPMNYFQPQMVPGLPQYTNLDIPSQLDSSLKQMKDTLSKLKQENSNLKNELNKKQVINADMENSLQTFDKEKYQQFAQDNLRLKQNLEDLKRREVELKSRLSSLQANKQYLHGRANTLSMDIDAQDKQEEALSKQVVSFNQLIREKEQYIKTLMNELNSLKENKEQFQSELQVLSHKEEFLINELIFKEDQLNEVMMNNEDMKRKINSGQSQSKYILAENERLKKELSGLREELAINKASGDFLQSELMGLQEHLNEYEHKTVLSQNTVEQLQRQNGQDRQELQHLNATMGSQQKAYEELKGQLQIINERNSRISMQNEMMMMRQQQQQEQMMMQMTAAANMRRAMQEELAVQTSQADRDDFEQRSVQEDPFPQRQQAAPREQQPREPMSQPKREGRREVQQREAPATEQRRGRGRVQVDLGGTGEEQRQSREGSPYQEIQKKSKQSNNMQNTLTWGDPEEEGMPQPHRQQTQPQGPPAARVQGVKQKTQMGNLLNWNPDEQVTRHSQPARMEPRKFQVEGGRPEMRRGDEDDDLAAYNSQERQQRSRSNKRQDQMNNLLRWEEEDTIKDRRIQQSEQLHSLPQNQQKQRSPSNERKRVRAHEGQDMQQLIAFQEKSSPFKEKQAMREAEEARHWKGRGQERGGGAREQLEQQYHSPADEGRQIRSLHYGQTMAGLLQFQQEDGKGQPPVLKQQQQQQQPGRQADASKGKYGQIQVSLQPPAASRLQTNQSFNISKDDGIETPSRAPKRYQNTGPKRAAIDLIQDEAGGSQQQAKNYGQVSEQIHAKQINRKENLDKFLLQMQIEREKLVQENNRIGEFPKTVQQNRRKEEIAKELMILNNNITNTKNKLKQLKP